MSKIALYEQTEGKTPLKLSKYYISDFKSANRMKSIPAGIVAYALIVFLYVTGVSEGGMPSLFVAVGDVPAVLIIFAVGIVFTVIYQAAAGAVITKLYRNISGSLWQYRLNLSRLEKIYEAKDSDEASAPDKEHGREDI